MTYSLFMTPFFKKNILFSNMKLDQPIYFKNLIFPENSHSFNTAEALYVVPVMASQIQSLALESKKHILFICDPEASLSPKEMDSFFKESSYLVFKGSFYKTLVYLNSCMNHQALFLENYNKLSDTHDTVSSLLMSLKQSLDAEVFILDRHSKKMIASTCLEKNKEILDSENADLSDDFSTSTMRLKLTENKRIIIISASEKPFDAYSEFLAFLGREKLLNLIYNKEDLYEVFKQYSTLLQNTLENKISTLSFYEELKIIDKMNKNERPYYFIVSITFNSKTNNINRYTFFERLKEIFGAQFIGNSGNIFHVVFRTLENSNDFPMKIFNKLECFCQQYHSFAVISGRGFEYERIKTTVLMNLSMFKLGVVFREQEDEKIFFFQNYSLHFLIDFFNKNFKNQYPETGITYLLYLPVYKLYSYDKVNASNLIEILYTYLINKLNIKNTSEKLYMHRNTLFKKLKLIEEITGKNIDDVDFQYKAMFSHLVIEYYENIEKKRFDVRILDFP